MIRSYELGIMFLPPLSRRQRNGVPTCLATTESRASENFNGTLNTQRIELLPLPYRFPLITYDPKKDEPWVWDLVRESPDIFCSAFIPH
ncbi:putative tyrosyl-DNA phosphodiesterase I [Plasmopara halstedii]